MLSSLAMQSIPKSHLSFHLLSTIGLGGNWYILYQNNEIKTVIGGLVSAQLSLMLLLLTFQGLIALFQPADNLDAPHLGRRVRPPLRHVTEQRINQY